VTRTIYVGDAMGRNSAGFRDKRMRDTDLIFALSLDVPYETPHGMFEKNFDFRTWRCNRDRIAAVTEHGDPEELEIYW
jgi:hypothetical protein